VDVGEEDEARNLSGDEEDSLLEVDSPRQSPVHNLGETRRAWEKNLGAPEPETEPVLGFIFFFTSSCCLRCDAESEAPSVMGTLTFN